MIPYNFGEAGPHSGPSSGTPFHFSDFTPSPSLSNALSLPDSDIFLDAMSSAPTKSHSFTPITPSLSGYNIVGALWDRIYSTNLRAAAFNGWSESGKGTHLTTQIYFKI